MLEILAVYVMAKKIAEMANEKGRSGIPYVLMLIGLWIGGEIGGAVLGVILTQGKEENILMVYGLALGGAICGAVISFAIVGLLPPANTNTYDDDYRPRKKRKREREYDDYDDYDDRPAR